MKLSLVAACAAACLLAGCYTTGMESNHWHSNSVGPRIAYHFFGYDRTMDGDYSNRFGDDMSSIGLTLRRHFLNDDPENPLISQPPKKPYRPQPPTVEFELANKHVAPVNPPPPEPAPTTKG